MEGLPFELLDRVLSFSHDVRDTVTLTGVCSELRSTAGRVLVDVVRLNPLIDLPGKCIPYLVKHCPGLAEAPPLNLSTMSMKDHSDAVRVWGRLRIELSDMVELTEEDLSHTTHLNVVVSDPSIVARGYEPFTSMQPTLCLEHFVVEAEGVLIDDVLAALGCRGWVVDHCELIGDVSIVDTLLLTPTILGSIKLCNTDWSSDLICSEQMGKALRALSSLSPVISVTLVNIFPRWIDAATGQAWEHLSMVLRQRSTRLDKWSADIMHSSVMKQLLRRGATVQTAAYEADMPAVRTLQAQYKDSLVITCVW